MLSKCKDVSPMHKFRFKNPVFSIDATTIKLCLNLYNWAKFRTRKGAVKPHVKLNHAGYLPEFMLMTIGKVHEAKIAPIIPVNQGDIFVVDRGYIDFNWFKELDDKGAFFVTRLKQNSYYSVTVYKDRWQIELFFKTIKQ